MSKKKKVVASLLLLNVVGLGLASCSTQGSKSSSEPSNESSSISEAKHKVDAVSTTDVELKVDVNEAKEGDTVTITVNVLNAEKVLDGILVNGTSSGVTEVSKGSKYTYVMGNEDIKITAVLSDKVYQSHLITINQVEGFSIGFKVNDGDSSESASAKKGDLVTVIIDVASDTHRFKEITSNDVSLTISKNEGTHIEETFAMVDKEVSLTLVSEQIPTHSISVIASSQMSVKFFYKGEEITEGIEGKEIQIKITLQEKYAFKSIQILNDDVELKTVKEGEEYSFVMPNEDVSIIATCNEIINKYTLTDIQTCGGVSITSSLKVGAKIDEGETVKIAFTYKDKTDHDFTLSYGAYINNDLVMATLDDANKTGEISFVMPSKDTTIYVGPFNEPVAEASSSTSEVVLPELNDNYKIFGVKNGYYDQGVEYSCYRSMYLYILGKKEFVVSKFSFFNGRDVSMTAGPDGSYNFQFYNVSRGASTTLKVEGSIKELRSITFTDADKINIEGDYSFVPEGTQVALTITPKEGYGLKDNDSPNNYIIKNYQYGDKENTGISWAWDSYSNLLSFTMPSADLTITLNIVEQVALGVSNPDVLESYKFTEYSYSSSTAITSITGGSDVYFWPVAKSGQRIKGVYLNDSSVSLAPTTNSSGITYYKLNAPETGSAILTIETSALRNFTAESTDQYEVSSISSTSNIKDEEVSFKLVRKVGYRITKVSLSNGTEVSLKEGSDNTYSFLMPDENVSLVVTTEQVNTVSLTLSSDEPFSSYQIKDIYGNGINSDGMVNEGETYTLSFYVKNGYKVNGINLSSGEATKIDDASYSFVAPSADLVITPDFSESEKHTITIANESTDNYEITSILDDNTSIKDDDVFNGYVGHAIKIRIDSKDNSSKVRYFANAKVVNASTGEEISFNVNTQNEDTLNVSFIMPSFDVKLEFDILEKQQRQIIKGENGDMLKVCNSGSYYAQEISSFVTGTTLFVSLNLNAYQSSFYSSFALQYSYVEDGETKSETKTFSYSSETIKIEAPDSDITFNLIVTEPTEKVTVSKEENDQISNLILTDSTYGDDFGVGNSFEYAKGETLYAKLNSSALSLISSGSKFTITITNADTSEIIKTFEITSTYGTKYVSFKTDCNILVSLTYTQGTN